MKLQEIQDTLQTVIQDISSLNSSAVYWDQLPGGFVPDVWVRLSLGTIRKLGIDETRYAMDYSDTLLPVYREVRHGIRMVNVIVAVESRNQNLAYGSQAVADRIKTRLYKRNVLETLTTEAEVALSSIGDVRTIDRLDKNTGRLVSYSVFELNLSTYTTDMDTSEDGSSWIETADITHNYEDMDSYIKTYPIGIPVELGGIYTQDEDYWIGTQDGFALVTQYQYNRSQ